jgi:hypothetical protein
MSLVLNLLVVLIDLLFRSPATIDWKFKIEFSLVIAAICSLIVFASTWADARAEGVRDHTVDPAFPGGSFYRGLYAVGAVGSLMMMAGLYRQQESLWQQLIPLGFLVLVWFGWPRSIYFHADALGQKTRFGKMRRLEYSAVEYISFDKREACTIVAGGGIKIVHTPQHASRDLFQELIQERTGKPVWGA